MSRNFSQRRSCFGLSLKTGVYMLWGWGGGIILHRKSLTSLKDEENLQPGPLGPAPLAPAAFPVVPP